MKKIFASILMLLLLAPAWASAMSLLDFSAIQRMRENAGAIGVNNYDVATTDMTLSYYISKIITVFLGLLAVIFIILIIIAGFNWLTARGDKTKVESATATMRNAVIGLIIIASAYAITYWIFARLPDSQYRLY